MFTPPPGASSRGKQKELTLSEVDAPSSRLTSRATLEHNSYINGISVGYNTVYITNTSKTSRFKQLKRFYVENQHSIHVFNARNSQRTSLHTCVMCKYWNLCAMFNNSDGSFSDFSISIILLRSQGLPVSLTWRHKVTRGHWWLRCNGDPMAEIQWLVTPLSKHHTP